MSDIEEASDESTPPWRLDQLVESTDVNVRSAIARNPSTDDATRKNMLWGDWDEAVRIAVVPYVEDIDTFELDLGLSLTPNKHEMQLAMVLNPNMELETLDDWYRSGDSGIRTMIREGLRRRATDDNPEVAEEALAILRRYEAGLA